MRNKRTLILNACLLAVVVSLLAVGTVYGQSAQCRPGHSIPPIVSTDWLEANGNLENLVVLDIRSSAEYEAGHIANAVSSPFTDPFSPSIWVQPGLPTDPIWMEAPATVDLFNGLGSLGITKRSAVVVVGAGPDFANPPTALYPLANTTRVAATLTHAGIKEVAILDGGYAKWAAEGKPVTTEVPTVTPVTYRGHVDRRMFVTIDYVHRQIEKRHSNMVLLDARDTVVYTGEIMEPYALKPGHIPTARSLPTPSIWNADGTYKSVGELKALASEVIGRDKYKHIVVYCGVGGYASSWWFVLTEVLGYRNVSMYDGSAQEWVLYYDMVLD
ncbi:MAG: sulfurtransferase [Anaerolineae bacterium]|nr:sulfurtransferase [Anaerolineae bacterium]